MYLRFLIHLSIDICSKSEFTFYIFVFGKENHIYCWLKAWGDHKICFFCGLHSCLCKGPLARAVQGSVCACFFLCLLETSSYFFFFFAEGCTWLFLWVISWMRFTQIRRIYKKKKTENRKLYPSYYC